MISMAIKYVILPEKKTVIAILKNTKHDAYHKAMKICRDVAQGQTSLYLCPNMEKLIMPNEFKGIVVCKDGDVFNEETGKKIAKKICMDKYYASLDKRVNKFIDDMRKIKFNFQNMDDQYPY